jgi:HK97 family phage prohead protease
VEHKSYAFPVKSIEDRTVIGITAVMGNIDDGGDRIFPGAFSKTLKERLDRVQHLWQHDASQPPTAVIKSAEEVGVADLPMELLNKFPMATGGLQIAREYLPTPRGEEVLRGIAAGAIKEMSFGYDAVKYDFEEVQMNGGKQLVRNLRELRLWDTSDVNWGMNPATVASKMLDDDDNDSPFAHHTDGAATWDRVRGAMSVLMDAKASPLPEDGRREVYNHLAEHYKELGKEAPSFEVVQIAHWAGTINVDEVKAGRVLSANNLNRLKEALATLQDILAAAEPQDDPAKVAALTARVLRRLAIADRDPLLLSVR